MVDLDYKIINKTASLHWQVDEINASLIIDGKAYRVQTLLYFANGTKDIYSVKNKKGTLELRSKQSLKPSDTILCEWNDDIAIFKFFEPLPPPINKTVLYLEMNDSLVPFINTIFRLHPSMKSKHYDAYLGRKFSSLKDDGHTQGDGPK